MKLFFSRKRSLTSILLQPLITYQLLKGIPQKNGNAAFSLFLSLCFFVLYFLFLALFYFLYLPAFYFFLLTLFFFYSCLLLLILFPCPFSLNWPFFLLSLIVLFKSWTSITVTSFFFLFFL